MVTPLRDRDELDVGGLERLIEHLADGGVSGVFILGTTGEGTALSYRLRRELIERTCREVRGRVQVLVGITDTAFVESVNLAKHSAAAGADAVVVAPPYYLPGGQPELQEYIEHLLVELPLPLVLYNIPSLTKVQFELDLVRRLMNEPRILGLKDSSHNMIYFHQLLGLLEHRPDWNLLMGPEELLRDAILAGGHGGIPGGANLFPQLYVQLYQAAAARNLARSSQLHAQIMRLSSSLYRVGRHPSGIIKGIKCGLACLGVCNDFMAEPFHRFRAQDRALVERHVEVLRAGVGKLVPAPTVPPRLHVEPPLVATARLSA